MRGGDPVSPCRTRLGKSDNKGRRPLRAMAPKNKRTREEISPVKLNIDAEEALSLLSPVSKPVQFKRRLSKYQKVLSPGVTAYISNVVTCYVCNKTEAVWTRLDNTLDLIHDQLHQRLSQAFEKALEYPHAIR